MTAHIPAVVIVCTLLGVFANPETTQAQVAESGVGQPLFILRTKPTYPPAALEQQLRGHVTVDFTISETGGIRNAVVVDSSDAVFEPAVLQALQRWRYDRQDAGRKVRQTIEFKGETIEFKREP